MTSKERIQIFIDGGNFHHLVLRKLQTQEAGFNFEGFINFLANGREIAEEGKRFYVGTVRERPGDPRSKNAMARQTSFFATLKSTGWEIKTSKLRTRMEKIVIDERVVGYQDILKKGIREVEFERTREKGIDVKLATDMVVGAVDDKYDTAILVSSDGDLIPAVDWIRKRKRKKIEYIGFSIIDSFSRSNDARPVQGLITNSDIQRILVATDLQKFIIPGSKTLI